jgi:opacity protein-like surface antigen
MKKFKLFIASLVVSLSLASAPALANPTVKDPPKQANATQPSSFSDWFYDWFDWV